MARLRLILTGHVSELVNVADSREREKVPVLNQTVG